MGPNRGFHLLSTAWPKEVLDGTMPILDRPVPARHLLQCQGDHGRGGQEWAKYGKM